VITFHADQMAALEAQAELAFVEEMTDHLWAFSPALCKTLGREKLRAVVVDGVARAAGYGLTYRNPIRLFLELCFILGSGFDEDPQVPWAGETLRRDDFFNQMFKAGRLEHLAREYVTAVQGPDNVHAHAALVKLEALTGRDDLIFHRHSVRKDILAAMESTFPTKLAFIGAPAAEEIVRRAEARAEELFGDDDPRSVAVLAILMFSFGVKCLEDPLYPWLAATLHNPRSTDAASRAVRLERRALIWLRAVNADAAATGHA
jgi:hypothetical protein